MSDIYFRPFISGRLYANGINRSSVDPSSICLMLGSRLSDVRLRRSIEIYPFQALQVGYNALLVNT